MGGGLKNIIGRVFGRLEVMYRVADVGNRVHWRVQCFCGNEIIVSGVSLRTNHTRSCGCLHREVLKAKMTTHGLSKKQTFMRWSELKQRCTNKNNTRFSSYGGRGIEVCKEWSESFAAFYRDMGDVPFKGAQIDRIDNDKGYVKENCRWSTPTQNINNRRCTVFLTICGEMLAMAEAARRFGVNYSTLKSRIKKGWSTEKALGILA